MKSKAGSRRADLLKGALEHINTDNYEDGGDYLIFGAESVHDLVEELTAHPGKREEPGISEAVVQAVPKLVSDAKVHEGRKAATERITLDEQPNFPTGALEGLSANDLDALRELLEKAQQDRAGAPTGPPERSVTDELDAYFAEEVLGKLTKIIQRVSPLDPVALELGRVPHAVRMYFAEAHRCYLYGFPVACAVLSRAILESALGERMDHDSVIKQQISGNESYICRLVEEAKKRHVLTDDRPQCVIEVKDAGNLAIHDYGKFEKRLQELGGIAYIVDSTRKILIDLYSDGS